MGWPEFMQYRCAGCGAVAEGTAKPCDCITNVGYRTGPNGHKEKIIFEPNREKQWDEWYARLPDDLKQRCSLYDFKRLGELFKEVFDVS